ncbi:hypothetical protein ACPWT1_21920 [Ramlibacter sp. MMS24-I3-19]
MHAPIPPRLDREEPELWMEDDIPTPAADEAERWEMGRDEPAPKPE